MRHIGAPVTGARCHHHRCGANGAAVGKRDPERGHVSQSSLTASTGIAISVPNFCGLHGAASGEVWPGDAEGKAEIVLDARARPGLAANGSGIEDDH